MSIHNEDRLMTQSHTVTDPVQATHLQMLFACSSNRIPDLPPIENLVYYETGVYFIRFILRYTNNISIEES